jgi:hypothetical protein
MKAVDARQDLSQVQETAAGRRRRRLESFHPCYRRYIAELTCCASEVEDLADSFPGLLFALVSRYATVEQRQRAFDLVCTGEPLRQAADAWGWPGGCADCLRTRSRSHCQRFRSMGTSPCTSPI